tara:strand:+ start:3532 stop:4521 length:990 start_codon:yes stop_codon:yes gene_type:complete
VDFLVFMTDGMDRYREDARALFSLAVEPSHPGEMRPLTLAATAYRNDILGLAKEMEFDEDVLDVERPHLSFASLAYPGWVELHRYFRLIDEAEREHGREDVAADLEDSIYLLPLLERPRSYIREVRRYFAGERDIRARADGRVFSQISGLADRSITTTFDARGRMGDMEELVLSLAKGDDSSKGLLDYFKRIVSSYGTTNSAFGFIAPVSVVAAHNDALVKEDSIAYGMASWYVNHLNRFGHTGAALDRLIGSQMLFDLIGDSESLDYLYGRISRNWGCWRSKLEEDGCWKTGKIPSKPWAKSYFKRIVGLARKVDESDLIKLRASISP